MRLKTRTFLWSFLPFAVLLTGSFWFVQHMAVWAIREQVRASARESQASTAHIRAASERRNGRILRIVAENPALKNGLQLLLAKRNDFEARRTVEEQLAEIGEELGFDLLLVSDTQASPLAGVMFRRGKLVALDVRATQPPSEGYFDFQEKTYQTNSVPIDEGAENLGILTMGEPFEVAGLPTPAVLLHQGRVVESSATGVSLADLQAALDGCSAAQEYEIRLAGAAYSSSTMEKAARADGYELRSLQDLDSPARPIQNVLRSVLLGAGLLALAGALALSTVSSRSILRPISSVISRLRSSESTGELPEFRQADFRSRAVVHEIRELMEAFNRAAGSVRESRHRLSEAVLEFIQSLASALDARDTYTAGHSRRVSQYACAIARAMKLSPTEIDSIRIGALLHDIGKIGVSDNILQKPGKLSPEENRLIQEHPSIGRKILENVQGFHPYLPIVELHHENWDGTGYPRGLDREQTPLAARIVKVADAYDAMTSDRPYRPGMRHDEALAVLKRFAGTQMDPGIVEVFVGLGIEEPELAAVLDPADSLARLADAVGSGVTPGRLVHKEVA